MKELVVICSTQSEKEVREIFKLSQFILTDTRAEEICRSAADLKPEGILFVDVPVSMANHYRERINPLLLAKKEPEADYAIIVSNSSFSATLHQMITPFVDIEQYKQSLKSAKKKNFALAS